MLATELLDQSICVLFRGNFRIFFQPLICQLYLSNFASTREFVSYLKTQHAVVEISTLNVMNWVWNRLLVILTRYLGQHVFIYKKKGHSIIGILSDFPTWHFINRTYVYYMLSWIFKWSSHVFSPFYALSSLPIWLFKDPFKMWY